MSSNKTFNSSSYELNNSSQNNKNFIKITSTGILDLELTLLLSTKEAELLNFFPEKIKTISDFETFLQPQNKQMPNMTLKSEQFQNAKNIFNFFRLSSENLTINSLLVLNRASNKKAFIEFIALSEMRFRPENDFLRDVIKTVCENNFLFLVENNFLNGLNSKVKFVVKIENKVVKVFENICEVSLEELSGKKELLQQQGIKNDIYIEEHNNYFKENEDENENENDSIKEVSGNKISVKAENESLQDNFDVKSKSNYSKVNLSLNDFNNRSKNEKNDSFNNLIDKDIDKLDQNITNSESKEDSKLNLNDNLIATEEKENIIQNASSLSKKEEILLLKNSLITENNNEYILENSNAAIDKQEFSKKNSLNNNLVFQEQLIADQAELIELEMELAENQLKNENQNKSNFNNELDETANKILESIPNEVQNESRNNIIADNQSKISNANFDDDQSREKLSKSFNKLEENSSNLNNELNKIHEKCYDNIIIQENSFHNIDSNNNNNNKDKENKNKSELTENNNTDNNIKKIDLNLSKSKLSQDKSIKSTSNLNSFKHSEKNILYLNESPIKETGRPSNFSNKELISKSNIAINNKNNNIINNNNNIKNLSKSQSLSMLGNEEASLIYEKFNYDFSTSDYFFIDLNDIIDLKNFNFSLANFNSLLSKIAEDHKQTTIIINFPSVISKINLLDLPAISVLTEVLSLTDIFLFEKKDALALFNLLAQVNSSNSEKLRSFEENKKLEILFIKEIKKKRKALPKTGIFLDGFKKATIIEQQASSNLVLFHTDYEFNLLPLNVAAKSLADIYKKLFVVQAQNLKSIFFGGLFSRMLYKKPFPSAFSAATESLRKMLELTRLGAEAPLDANFYLVKIPKENNLNLTKSKSISAATEQKTQQSKEQRFVLDCANVMSSRMKSYNALLDENLGGFFSSKKIRGHLHKQGFISKSDEVVEDPDAQKLGLFQSSKLCKAYEEQKTSLLKLKDKKEKLKLQIKSLLQGNALVQTGDISEIAGLTKVFNFSPQAIKKLPKQLDSKFNFTSFKKELERSINFRSCELTYKKVTQKLSGNLRKGKDPKGAKRPSKFLNTLGRIEDFIIFGEEDENYFGANNVNNLRSVDAKGSGGVLEGRCGFIIEEKEEEEDIDFNNSGKVNSRDLIVEENEINAKNETNSYYEKNAKFDNNYNVYNENNSSVNLNLNTKERKTSGNNSRIFNSKILNDNNFGKSKIIKTDDYDSYLTSKEINNKSKDIQIQKEIEQAEQNEKFVNSKINISENKYSKNDNLVNLSNISKKENDLSVN